MEISESGEIYNMRVSEYEAAIEAILFTMGDSVELSRLAAALEISEKETDLVVKNLMDRYKNANCGLQILELDGAYQMCTKASQYEYLIKIAAQPKRHQITEVMLETLSIVAYKQPVTRSQIEAIRGVSCEHAINRLVEYGLIQEVGRLDSPGRPILFGTTEEFLRCFGVQSVDDLPTISQDRIDEIKEEAEAEAQLTLDI